jgi:hypothetical protein
MQHFPGVRSSLQANVRMPDAEDAITVTLTIDGRMRTLNRCVGLSCNVTR